ncbi:LLM class flavin-dependent oxidoreductase [Dactylosporangium sp. AC04546]|uniref:LLM class flavin-dependent oxidoreductase n=1 Tax=Dactylosporangium sp. AC04546 TaxID=2862460 RepID=UPI001EDF6745|nr:LLM class flavin-dependent oxidoreductase [Dactylosporangium sp. AC04546]WVK87666.1 LLM class flavin-dependent oxidoreductase [Dactylosporangium sp. AC04546]
MDIGIGLPTTLDIVGPDLVAWARRAEERGFSSLGTIDRIVYPNYDSLTALAAAAAATSRIRLFTDILLTPLYPPVHLAKVTASVDALSGGRLTLGLGVGGRPDDFAAMERPFKRRGSLMDEALELLHRAWAGEPVAGGSLAVGPRPVHGRVPIIMGGTGDKAVERTVRWADGWTMGGGGPEAAAQAVPRIQQAWREGGRDGDPRLAALCYYGFADATASSAALRRYYGFLGEYADRVAQSALTTPAAAAAAVRAFADAGVTELVFFPTIPQLSEVDALADAVLQ